MVQSLYNVHSWLKKTAKKSHFFLLAICWQKKPCFPIAFFFVGLFFFHKKKAKIKLDNYGSRINTQCYSRGTFWEQNHNGLSTTKLDKNGRYYNRVLRKSNRLSKGEGREGGGFSIFDTFWDQNHS